MSRGGPHREPLAGDGRPRPGLASRIVGRAAAWALLASALAAPAALGATSSGGLVYSRASARVIQRQPPAGSCHARGTGLYALPDPRCTPGALNPEVTQGTIFSTICRRGWTATVRPPQSVTGPEKLASLRAYGAAGTSGYEYDHLVSLELGGAVNDPRNLWPERDYAVRSGFYLNPKDKLEGVLKRLVCSGAMRLATAQRLIAREWAAAYARYARTRGS